MLGTYIESFFRFLNRGLGPRECGPLFLGSLGGLLLHLGLEMAVIEARVVEVLPLRLLLLIYLLDLGVFEGKLHGLDLGLLGLLDVLGVVWQDL